MNFRFKQTFKMLALAGLISSLAACGGGGGTHVRLKVSGVAATGYAIPGANVSVQCVSGRGVATTEADGSYTITINNGQGPCIVTVQTDKMLVNGVVTTVAPYTLTSITPPATLVDGIAVTTANVSPLSTAVVAALVAAKGAPTVADLVNENSTAIPTAADLLAASTTVITTINQTLLDNGASPDQLLPANLGLDVIGKTTFVASTTDTPSDDIIDQVLDLLNAKSLITEDNTLDPVIQETITTEVEDSVDPNANPGNPNPQPTGGQSTGGTTV